jgi:hypothetical protein
MSRYTRWVPILFVISLCFLMIHALDDAYNLGEPRDWGVSTGEFLIIVASMYLIIPPLGAALARRGNVWGFVIVLLYALQAYYGGGINHMRHLSGDFGGTGIIARTLMTMGISWGDIRGHGFVTGIAAMLGLGITSPHSHTWWSTAIAGINVLLNIPLIGLCVFGIIRWRREHREAEKSGVPAATPNRAGSKV